MKTPVLRPVVEAVTFGFERIGMIIRIAWFPILLSLAVYALVGGALCGATCSSALLVEAEGDAEEIAEAVAEALSGVNVAALIACIAIAGLLAGLVISPVMVAATRAATVGDYEPPPGPIYFAMGGRQLRYYAAYLLYAVLVSVLALVFGGLAVAIAIAALEGATSVSGGLGALPGAAGVGVGVAISLSFSGGLGALTGAAGVGVAISLALVGIWLALRFITVLPIAAVENRIDFGAAWRMTKGNFWRLLLSGLFFVNIVSAATGVLAIAILAPAALILGLISTLMSAIAGPAAFVLLFLMLLVAVPAFVAVASFSFGAQAAYPGRLYAYLSGCGDACKIL